MFMCTLILYVQRWTKKVPFLTTLIYNTFFKAVYEIIIEIIEVYHVLFKHCIECHNSSYIALDSYCTYELCSVFYIKGVIYATCTMGAEIIEKYKEEN